jgi:hypothetical protein
MTNPLGFLWSAKLSETTTTTTETTTSSKPSISLNSSNNSQNHTLVTLAGQNNVGTLLVALPGYLRNDATLLQGLSSKELQKIRNDCANSLLESAGVEEGENPVYEVEIESLIKEILSGNMNSIQRGYDNAEIIHRPDRYMRQCIDNKIFDSDTTYGRENIGGFNRFAHSVAPSIVELQKGPIKRLARKTSDDPDDVLKVFRSGSIRGCLAGLVPLTDIECPQVRSFVEMFRYMNEEQKRATLKSPYNVNNVIELSSNARFTA